MKKILIVLWSTALLAVSCKKEEIALYDSCPKLEFENRCFFDFNDKDYVEGRLEKEFELKTYLIGYALPSPMTYCVKFEEDSVLPISGNVSLFNPYEFPADSLACPTRIRLPRPGKPGEVFKMKLFFDEEKAEHRFEPGRVENSFCRVEIGFVIKPAAWDLTKFWGTFSNNKYLFMMDHFHKIYGDIPRTNENLREIAEAYKRYRKAGNPPLMDDEKESEEIHFPIENIKG